MENERENLTGSSEKENLNKDETKPEKESFTVRVINNIKENIRDKAASEDVIFSEPVHALPEEKPQPLVKGSIDIWFFIWAAMLLFFGTLMSYSASAVYAEKYYDSTTYFLVRNIIFAAVAIIVTIPVVMYMRPWLWKIMGVFIYAGAVLLLILVLLIGSSRGGAQRWIEIGPITIQPSEIAKLGIVMMLALSMSKYEKQINSKHKFGGNFKHGFLMPMIFIGIICGLVMLEKHISGLMIIGMIGVCVMYLAGTRIRWLAMLVGALGVAFVLLVLVSDYAQERVAIWLNIDAVDPLGSAWQTLQGLYAIGSGGFFGVGLGGSRQKFGYVSEPQNDFIFTIICEELGFVGAFAVVLLFALLIWRGIKIGQRAPDKFSALVVWGITFKIAIQVLLNIAVVTNSMPNTGISLPFFSAGGTSLMIQIFEIGIVLSMSRFSTRKK